MARFPRASGEHLIGTERGIVKCRAVRRLDEVGNFDAAKIAKIRGCPWQPVPGRMSMRIPTNIDIHGKVTNDNGENDGHSTNLHSIQGSTSHRMQTVRKLKHNEIVIQ